MALHLLTRAGAIICKARSDLAQPKSRMAGGERWATDVASRTLQVAMHEKGLRSVQVGAKAVRPLCCGDPSMLDVEKQIEGKVELMWTKGKKG
jgi:hypothetical protein